MYSYGIADEIRKNILLPRFSAVHEQKMTMIENRNFPGVTFFVYATVPYSIQHFQSQRRKAAVAVANSRVECLVISTATQPMTQVHNI